MISGEAIMRMMFIKQRRRRLPQKVSFPDLLSAGERVTQHLSQSAIENLLNPATRVGLSAKIAYQQTAVARRFADEIARTTKAGGKIADG